MGTVTARLTMLAGLLVAATVVVHSSLDPEAVPPRQPLQSLPLQVDHWVGHDLAPFDDDIVSVLGVDEYLNRVYVDQGRLPASLYVGYYESQREGDTIHSPMNCLPGAGWQPITAARVPIAVDGREDPAVVNRLLIQKGLDRQVVLYWYMSQGRVVASEYVSKAYLIYDALRSNRSDAAMIRIISPVLPSEPDDLAAEARAVAFAQALFPYLDPLLPS